MSARFSSTSLVYYNALLSLPFVAVFTWLSGDLDAALSYAHWGDVSFQVRAAAVAVCRLLSSTAACLPAIRLTTFNGCVAA